MMLLWLLSVASFLISLFTTGLIKQYFSKQLLDIPNERSSHNQPTPRGGGLGFIITFAVVGLGAVRLMQYFPENLSQRELSPNLLYLWLSLIFLVIIGFIDDYRNVPASIRYAVQLVSAVIAITCFGAFPLPWLTNWGTLGAIIAMLLTLIGITALINFYNFMDGLDGLVAGVSAVQLGFLALYLDQPILWLLVGAILGFLWWNWSPAKIFMGDVGSTVLGATVAIALLNTNQNSLQAYSALVISFPLVGDAIYTLIHRLLKGENIFQAHRSHLYQRLQQSGWSHSRVAILYISSTLLVASSIILLGQTGAWLSLVGVTIALGLGELYLNYFRKSRSQF